MRTAKFSVGQRWSTSGLRTDDRGESVTFEWSVGHCMESKSLAMVGQSAYARQNTLPVWHLPTRPREPGLAFRRIVAMGRVRTKVRRRREMALPQ